MSVENEKTAIPIGQPLIQIKSRRATFKGIQYVVEDCYSTEIVTVNNGCIGCTCKMDDYGVTCQHILVVEKQEQAYVDEAAHRAEYVEVFNLY